METAQVGGEGLDAVAMPAWHRRGSPSHPNGEFQFYWLNWRGHGLDVGCCGPGRGLDRGRDLPPRDDRDGVDLHEEEVGHRGVLAPEQVGEPGGEVVGG